MSTVKKSKKTLDANDIIRSAAAAVGLYSVCSISRATGIPESTLRKKLKNFQLFSVGELSALMRELPTLTDEVVGRAVREANK